MKPTSSQLEIEVKFHLNDPACIHQRLKTLGARAGEKVFETNVRFEDKDSTLINTNRLLRLRRDTSCRLTYKSPPDEQHGECKAYHELEVGVSDFNTMKAILKALGYHGVQIYEKWRQVYAWNEVHICMDTMPYGEFLEIEGSEEKIKHTAKALDLHWHQRILENYLAIFDRIYQANDLLFTDVTFDHFKKHPVDITPHLSTLEAGRQSNL